MPNLRVVVAQLALDELAAATSYIARDKPAAHRRRASPEATPATRLSEAQTSSSKYRARQGLDTTASIDIDLRDV
jgi:hypothetical protein